MTKVVKKYEDCFFVRGSKRGVVYDLSRKKFDHIPLSMVDWVEMIDGRNETALKKIFEGFDSGSVHQYMEFLEENEYIFYCEENEAGAFAKLSLDFKSPSAFSSSIFMINNFDDLDWGAVLSKLEKVNCQHLQLFYVGEVSRLTIQRLDDFFTIWHNSRVKSVEFYIPHAACFDQVNWDSFFNRHKRIKSFIIHSSSQAERKSFGKYGMGNIVRLTIDVVPYTIKSMVHPYYFNTNIDLFTENHKYNSFYNKKLFVSELGEVLNDFGDRISFGHITEIDLIDLSKDDEYTKFWNLGKDVFQDCRECEYRYMCVDNRKPIQNTQGTWGHTHPCNYDPKTLEWKFKHD